MGNEKDLSKIDKNLLRKIQMLPINSVKPYEYNVKQHSTTQVRKIATSIMSYGWDQPIVVDSEFVIIKGHGRLEAAKVIGLDEVPVVVNTKISFEEAQAARIADNKVAESSWDVGQLWDELTDLKQGGIDMPSLGFDSKQLKRMFPDRVMAENDPLGMLEGTGGRGADQVDGRKSQKPVPPESKGVGPDGYSLDPTVPLEEGFIGYFKNDDAWLRKLSMVDYLNLHDRIIVGFSSGKDSMAALIWCLENCEKDKLFVYYTNPGWGVDWPHSLAFVPFMEKKYGIKVHMAGPSDPECIGGFVDNLIQMGYPGFGAGCWIESHVKIPRANALLRQEGLITKESGLNVVQIIGIRWEESPNRARIYPDRGYLKDNGNHYGNPVLRWTGADVAIYLQQHGLVLHTAYQNEGRMGCLMCPKGSPTGAVSIRKKFPEHWRRVMEFYAIGVRRGGKLPEHFRKWLLGIGDEKVHNFKFPGEFGELAVSTDALEDIIEETTGEKLPARPYLSKRFDPRIHKTKDDLKGIIFRSGRPEPGTYPECDT